MTDINEVMSETAHNLPPGWSIKIMLSNGFGSVELFDLSKPFAPAVAFNFPETTPLSDRLSDMLLHARSIGDTLKGEKDDSGLNLT